MAKIRLTKVMKDYIKGELMSPVQEWYDEEYEKIKQVQAEDLECLYVVGDECAEKLAKAMETIGYEVKNMKELKSRLQREIKFICGTGIIKIRDDKSLLPLYNKFEEKRQEVNKALIQIELECALGTDKEEFMTLLNDYKEKVVQDL